MSDWLSRFSNLRSSQVLPWYAQLGAAMVSLVTVFVLMSFVQPDAPGQPAVHAGVSSTVSFATISHVQDDGEAIYQRTCSSCHGAQGQGTTGVFPPVVDTDWVTGDPGRLIRLLMHGLEGAIEVQGVTYTRPMPGWGEMLDDEEMAAVLTYVRTSFGNEADPITEEDVRRVREATEGRRDAWRPSDFEDEENLGIPEEG